MSAHACDTRLDVDVDEVGARGLARWYVVCATCGLLDVGRPLTYGDAQALALDHERYAGRYGS
jgi:hypothetical protein